MNFPLSPQHMPSLQRAENKLTPKEHIWIVPVYLETAKIKMIVLPESRVEKKFFKNWNEFLGKMREKEKEEKKER